MYGLSWGMWLVSEPGVCFINVGRMNSFPYTNSQTGIAGCLRFLCTEVTLCGSGPVLPSWRDKALLGAELAVPFLVRASPRFPLGTLLRCHSKRSLITLFKRAPRPPDMVPAPPYPPPWSLRPRLIVL